MGSRDLTQEDHELIVQTIRVTIHTTGELIEPDIRSGNHASIYLLTSDGFSVRLNMEETWHTDIIGTYTQKHHEYQDAESSVINFDLPATPELTVFQVISLVKEKGRHRYQFTDTGVGCRHWVKTVVNYCNEKGYIAEPTEISAQSVTENLRYNYSRGRSPVFEEIEPGTFV